jgi:hypothetical protein
MVKFWDPRFSESVRNLETVINQMTSFEVHSAAKVIARYKIRFMYYLRHDIYAMLSRLCLAVFLSLRGPLFIIVMVTVYWHI